MQQSFHIAYVDAMISLFDVNQHYERRYNLRPYVHEVFEIVDFWHNIKRFLHDNLHLYNKNSDISTAYYTGRKHAGSVEKSTVFKL